MKYLVILIFTIFLLLILPVKFRIEFRLNGTNIFLRISSSYLFGIFSPEIYPFDKKGKKEKPNSNGFKVLKNIIRELEYVELLKYTWNRLHIEKLELITIISYMDPFIVAFLYGFLWLIKGISIGYLLVHKNIDMLNIDIIPLFKDNNLDIRFDCIIKMKMVYIINIWIKVKKIYKGGEKNDRTSNRRINEIYNE